MALPFAQVQAVGNSVAAGGANTLTLTWGANTTSGNTILVVVATGASATSIVTSIADTNGNSYVQVTSNVNTIDGELWGAKNINGGATPVITITFSASAVDFTALAAEYSGINRTYHLTGSVGNPADVRKTNTGNSTSITPGTTTATNQSTELIVLCGITQNATGGFTVGAGFGNLAARNGGASAVSVALQDKTVTTQGTQTGTMAVTTGLWVGILVGFVGVNNVVLPGNRGLRPHPFSPGNAR